MRLSVKIEKENQWKTGRMDNTNKTSSLARSIYSVSSGLSGQGQGETWEAQAQPLNFYFTTWILLDKGGGDTEGKDAHTHLCIGIDNVCTYYFAESFNWYSFDLEKHSWTPTSTHSLFMPANNSSEKGSVSSILDTTSMTILASPSRSL